MLMDALDLRQGFGSRGTSKAASMRKDQEPSCQTEMTTAGQSGAGGAFMITYLRVKIMHSSCERED